MPTQPYDDRLERLLETAARVFAAKGYHPTTMRDLARATGMSLAGMYYYVRGKDELLFLIQERCFGRVLEGAERAVRGGNDPIDRLGRFIHHHVTFFARHMSEMKVLSHEADALSGERHAVIDRLKRRYVKMLQELIATIEPSGVDRPDSRVSAYALFGMINWIYTWYDPEGPVTPDTLARQFTQLFRYGVAPTPSTISQGG
jgi:AcrR family transcriptional regulator